MIPKPIGEFPLDADTSTECYAVYNDCNGWSILDWPEPPEDIRTSRVWTHWLHMARPDEETSVERQGDNDD